MIRPVIFLVGEEAPSLHAVCQELEQRYAADYQILCEYSPEDGSTRLARLQAEGQPVAVMLADCRMAGTNGVEFLVQAHRFFPQAKLGLLVDWGDASYSDLIFEAIALNKVDAYAPKPVKPVTAPNEEFHHFISEFLTEWTRENHPEYTVFRIVGEQWDRRSYELRDLLSRNGVRFSFHDVHSEEGCDLLEQAQTHGSTLPLVMCYNGEILNNPTNVDLAKILGVKTAYETEPSRAKLRVDTVIVGAGPAGLSAAVNSASEGLYTVLIEREALGGQAGMSTRISNYLGFPTGIPGDELAARAYRQAQMFGVQGIFTQEVTGLKAHEDERAVILADGTEIPTRTIILATGMAYRRLEIPSLEKLVGKGVFYGAVGSEAMALKEREVVIVGGANSAGQAAVYLSRYARQVTMLVRSRSLTEDMSEYLIQEIAVRPNIRVLLNTRLVAGIGEDHLEGVVVEDKRTDKTETLPAAALFVMIGAVPHTAWLPSGLRRDRAGFILTGVDLMQNGGLPKRWPLQRLPLALETSIPGVFAVGDVRHGSVKRVASAVGEGSMAVAYLHQYLPGA